MLAFPISFDPFQCPLFHAPTPFNSWKRFFFKKNKTHQNNYLPLNSSTLTALQPFPYSLILTFLLSYSSSSSTIIPLFRGNSQLRLQVRSQTLHHLLGTLSEWAPILSPYIESTLPWRQASSMIAREIVWYAKTVACSLEQTLWSLKRTWAIFRNFSVFFPDLSQSYAAYS